jgi:hypothetical protein
MNPAVFHKSYSRLPLPARLGNLAVTINRLADSLEKHQNQEGTRGLVREAMWFIEWTAADLESDRTVALIGTQRMMGQWFKRWDAIWQDEKEWKQVGQKARDTSQELFQWAMPV